MAKKVTGKIAASAASKVLRDGRTSAASKTAAGSALSQRGKENKQPKKERREIYFALRSFNIYSSSRRKR